MNQDSPVAPRGRRWIPWTILGLAFAGLTVAAWWRGPSQRLVGTGEPLQGSVTSPAVPTDEAPGELANYGTVPAFELISQTGSTVRLADLQGSVWIGDFIFTNCASSCPMMSAQIQKLRAALGDVKGVRFVSFSVDPERDTPQQLGSYIASFRGDFIGLTGNASEIVKATRAFGVASARVDLGGGNYTMDHSATVFALDSQARIVAVFTPPLSAEKLTRDLARLKPVLKPRA